LLAIGRQFAHALQIPERGFRPALADLWARIADPWWLVLSGGLYLLGLGLSAVYWFGLLRALNQHPTLFAAVRAHFIGQMGKYLPGKAWALVLRASEVRGPKVNVGVAVMTSFYDVLTTMSAGAITAAVLFALQISDFSTPLDWSEFGRVLPSEAALGGAIDPKVMLLLSLLLLLAVGVPILPQVFNWISHRIAPGPRAPAALGLTPHRRQLVRDGNEFMGRTARDHADASGLELADPTRSHGLRGAVLCRQFYHRGCTERAGSARVPPVVALNP